MGETDVVRGVRHALGASSGTAALHLAVLAAGVGPVLASGGSDSDGGGRQGVRELFGSR